MCLTDAMISKSECVTEGSDCRYVSTRALKQTYTLHQQIFCSYFIFLLKKNKTKKTTFYFVAFFTNTGTKTKQKQEEGN